MNNDKPNKQFLENFEYHELLDDNLVNHRRIKRSSRPPESQSKHKNSMKSSCKVSSKIKNVSAIQRNGRYVSIENGQYIVNESERCSINNTVPYVVNDSKRYVVNDNAHYSVYNKAQNIKNKSIRYVVDNNGRYVVNNNDRRSRNNKVNGVYDDERHLLINKKDRPINDNREYVLNNTPQREVNKKESSLANKNSRHAGVCHSVNNNAYEEYDKGTAMNSNSQNVIKNSAEYVVHKSRRSSRGNEKHEINGNTKYFENNQKYVKNDIKGSCKTINNNHNAVCSTETKADCNKTQKEKEHSINNEKLPKVTQKHLEIYNENFFSDDSLSIDTNSDNDDKWSTAAMKFPILDYYIDDNSEIKLRALEPKSKNKHAENNSKQNVTKMDNGDEFWKDIHQLSSLCQKYGINFNVDPYALKHEQYKKMSASKTASNKMVKKSQKPKQKVVMLPAFYMTKGNDVYYQSETMSWKKFDTCNRFVDRHKDKNFKVDETMEVVRTNTFHPAFGRCYYATFPPDTSGYSPYGNRIRPNAKILKKKFDFKPNDLKGHIRKKLKRPMPWY